MFKAHYISIIYLLTALLIGLFAFLEWSESLDIVLHEIYFAVPKGIAWLVLAFCFLIFWAISLTFELNKKPINPYFFGAHYLLTVIGLAVFYFALPQEVSTKPYMEDFSISEEQTKQTINTVDGAPFIVYLIIGAQLIFVLNVLLSILKNRRTKQASNS